MRICLTGIILAIVLGAWSTPAAAQVLPSFGRDRAGTSGFQFLKIALDPRGAAMGQTVATSASDATSLFWNPALASRVDARAALAGGHVAYHADISLEYLAALYHLGRFTIGASVQALNSGEMDVTTEFEPYGTGETFRLVDLAAGLSVSQELTDLFSYGVTARYVRESVASIVSSTAVFDLGIHYRVGTTGAEMAVAIRNFGFDGRPSGEIERTVVEPVSVRVESDFESMTPPTSFLLGLSYHVFRDDPGKSLLLSAQLNNPNDNAESFNVGTEYIWNSLVALRAGYRFGVEEYTIPSLGFGIHLPVAGRDLRFDYGFVRLDRLGTVHRVGLDIQM
jgi:hypothetical protein